MVDNLKKIYAGQLLSSTDMDLNPFAVRSRHQFIEKYSHSDYPFKQLVIKIFCRYTIKT